MENNDIMKFEEVMEYLDIGKNTLYGLLKRGELNAFRDRQGLEDTKKIKDNQRSY